MNVRNEVMFGWWINFRFKSKEEKRNSTQSFHQSGLLKPTSESVGPLGFQRALGVWRHLVLRGAVKGLSHSVVSDSVTPGTVAHQAPLFMAFSRREDWSGLPLLLAIRATRSYSGSPDLVKHKSITWSQPSGRSHWDLYLEWWPRMCQGRLLTVWVSCTVSVPPSPCFSCLPL